MLVPSKCCKVVPWAVWPQTWSVHGPLHELCRGLAGESGHGCRTGWSVRARPGCSSWHVLQSCSGGRFAADMLRFTARAGVAKLFHGLFGCRHGSWSGSWPRPRIRHGEMGRLPADVLRFTARSGPKCTVQNLLAARSFQRQALLLSYIGPDRGSICLTGL